MGSRRGYVLGMVLVVELAALIYLWVEFWPVLQVFFDLETWRMLWEAQPEMWRCNPDPANHTRC